MFGYQLSVIGYQLSIINYRLSIKQLSIKKLSIIGYQSKKYQLLVISYQYAKNNEP